jgi:hypothetical protein
MRDQRVLFQMRRRILQSNDQPFWMRGRIEPSVTHVFSFAREIQLGYQAIEPAYNGEVNVRRPNVAFCRRIAARFDRTKAVVPGRIRCETREALEIGIERRRVLIGVGSRRRSAR